MNISNSKLYSRFQFKVGLKPSLFLLMARMKVSWFSKILIVIWMLAITVILFSTSCDNRQAPRMILVEGGEFKNPNSGFYRKNIVVNSFYIGNHEVTQKEWFEIMGNNPSRFIGDNLPVEMVSWYDAILFCNKKSVAKGLVPFYNIEINSQEAKMDTSSWIVTINEGANGYRLPTEIEWEFAASGGNLSRGYKYSGSNEVKRVAWFWVNSGDEVLTGIWDWDTIVRNNNRTHPVGSKKPNELGIYDMSGNVREWCADLFEGVGLEGGVLRVQRGGGWIGGDHACVVSFRGKFEALGKGPDQGFRIARSVNSN